MPLALGALGVVYGDIGTSPLYVMKALFFGGREVPSTAPNVLGATSLVFWSLALVVALKYLVFVVQAAHNGEGGVFALLGLLLQRKEGGPRRRIPLRALTLAILAGAALLFGDGIITPAISVLSACEGLEVATRTLRPAVVPTTVVVLAALFFFQSQGTGRLGGVFGAITVLWFAALAASGLPWIARHPEVLRAVDPLLGARFLWAEGADAVHVVGAVVLCVTGCEALYADLGHFGPKAIRASWFALVYPSLLVNYFGQGARLLDAAPVPNGHVFYALFPDKPWIFYPAVALATMATIIASQALISGAFSLARQAMALGYFPRLKIVFTSAEIEGQVYMPGVNWALFAGCAALVLAFRNSNGLAAAYGIAVTGTMAVTTCAFFFVARDWGWRDRWLVPVCALFLGIDLVFLGANLWKFFDGGFVPVAIAAALLALMKSWRWGRDLVAGAYRAFANVPLGKYVELKRLVQESPNLRARYGQREVVQVERAVVFLSSRRVASLDDPCPVGLRVYIRRNGAIPKHVVILHVAQLGVPFVPEEGRFEVASLGAGVVAVDARWGYMQTPDVPKLLRALKGAGLIKINERRWTIQSGEEALIPAASLSWLERHALGIFQQILHWSTPADRYFGLREHSGRNKIVVPVLVERRGARVAISDEEVG